MNPNIFTILKACAVAVLAGIAFWLWGLEAFILWFLFLTFLFYRFDSRVIGVLAILSLITCPILLSLEMQAEAEQMAVYAYFFLVMTVVLQIVEFKRDERSEPREKEKTISLPKRHDLVLDLRQASRKETV